MNFEYLLLKAKDGDPEAVKGLIEMYHPLLVKNSVVDGKFDEDLYQELVREMLISIRTFQIW